MVAESVPREFVAVQLKLVRAVCTFETLKYCLSQTKCGGSQGLQEIVGFGFPSTWQVSDAVFPWPTKTFFASLTLGETGIKKKKCNNKPSVFVLHTTRPWLNQV